MARAANYNVSAKLKKLKKLAQHHFLAGNSVEVVAGVTGLSKDMLQEWHDEFLILTLKGSSSRRLFLRELLLKNAPQMILILSELAKNKGDEKLAYSASSAILSFSSKFMNEDARVLQAEQQIRKDSDGDTTFNRSLFDIRDPDINGSTGSKDGSDGGALFAKASLGEERLSQEAIDQIEAAAARLEEKSPLPGEGEEDERESDSSASQYHGDVDLFEGLDD